MNEPEKQICAYAEEHYGVEPDYPCPNDPETPVLRHPGPKKRFAILMNVSRSTLHLDGDGYIDIMNVKCDPILSGSLRMEPGFLPAYHMNHDLWLTILLDGTVPFEELTSLLDMSFDLTMKKPKKRNKSE